MDKSLGKVMKAVARMHERFKPKRNWSIELVDGEYNLAPSTTVGTKPGFRWAAKQMRRDVNGKNYRKFKLALKEQAR